jgi:hypothetical protein
VLVVRRVAPGRDRVVAAHYARPLARDPGGHVQRQGPAVLASWDPATDTFELFAWGVASELAGRIGFRRGALDAEIERRAEEKVWDVWDKGGGRTYRYSREAAPMRLTLVNGVPTFDHGKFTGRFPGEFIGPEAVTALAEAAE